MDDKTPFDDEETANGNTEAARDMVRMWRTWRTVFEMLADRGYQVQEEEMKITLPQFRQKFAEIGTQGPDRRKMRTQAVPSPEMLALHTPLPTAANPNPVPRVGTIWVEFSPDSQIGVKHCRAFAQYLDQNGFSTGIIISQGSVTASALRAFEPLAALGITAEHFQESDLLVNITRHELVPKHVLLSAKEKQVLLERYRLRETQLPRIQHSDPVARYLGLKRGNVVKIIRRSETAGRYASYRWVF